jgi:Flp pilus assembly protein TadD
VQAGFKSAVDQANAGQNDAAIETLKGVLSQDPSQYWAQFDLGALLERKGQNDAALDAYRKALELKPDLGAAAMASAKLLVRQPAHAGRGKHSAGWGGVDGGERGR